MGKKLKTDSDQDCPPLQQQQMQQQIQQQPQLQQQQPQLQQQQQQPMLRNQVVQHNTDENFNILGSANTNAQVNSHNPLRENNVLSSSASFTPNQSLFTGQQQQNYQFSSLSNSHHPQHQLPGYNPMQTSSPAVSYSTKPLPVQNTNNFSYNKPLPYGATASQTEHVNQVPTTSHTSFPSYQNVGLQSHANQHLANESNRSAATFSNTTTSASNLASSHSGGGSIAIYKPPGGGAQITHRDDMLLATPGPSHYKGDEGTFKIIEDYLDHMIQGDAIEPARGPPVAQFPQRNNFSGIYGLQVSFPGESPKLVMKEDQEGNSYLFTELGHPITTMVRHSADQSTAMRFLVVYSKDCEATQAVHPCKNHQNSQRPNHMLEVSAGSSRSIWNNEPHPSIIVSPSPTSEGRYSVQMKFLCRNSCITRKNLTLICQLEREAQVVGRKCMELKISACPRRDAKSLKNCKDQQETDVVDGAVEVRKSTSVREKSGAERPSLVSSAILPPVIQANSGSISDVLSAALESGRRAAYSAFMEKKYQEEHPAEYAQAKEEFSSWWESTGTVQDMRPFHDANTGPHDVL